MGSLLLFHLGRSTFEVGKHGQLTHQNARCITDRLFRIDDAIGFHVHDQLVQIGALFDARAFDMVAHLADRTEQCIDHDRADGAIFVCVDLAHRNRLISTSHFDLGLQVELATLGQVSNHVIRIDDFQIMPCLEVASGDHSLIGLAQRENRFGTTVQLEGHTLQVEQDIDYIFLQTVDGGILVNHTINLDFGNRISGNRGQQHTAQGVAQRVAEAALHGLKGNACAQRRNNLHIHDTGLEIFCRITLHNLPLRYLWITWSKVRPPSFR